MRCVLLLSALPQSGLEDCWSCFFGEAICDRRVRCGVLRSALTASFVDTRVKRREVSPLITRSILRCFLILSSNNVVYLCSKHC